jgi:hemerythrin-like domain-containing protein
MEPIQLLMDEHQVILKGMDALEGYVEDGKADAKDLACFVEFIRRFADAIHHGKEEDILFAEMEAAGFPADSGPLAVMLGEHDEGRRLTGILAGAAEAGVPWTEGPRQAVRDAAHGYAALLRQHIQKEDQILYPMAQAHLPMEAWEGIRRRFEVFEAREAVSGERLRALAQDLASRYLSSPARA